MSRAPNPSSRAPSVLIAFDKFKDALSAHEACEIAARVVRRVRPSWSVDLAPLSDGGDGFCRVLTQAAQGVFASERASGPLFTAAGASTQQVAAIGIVSAAQVPPLARERLAVPLGACLAIVEMAAVNGLALVPPEQRDVWHASSYGTGELLLAARARGASVVLLGVGGSATSDLGLGALCALGFVFEDGAGQAVFPPVPALWPRVARVAGAPRPGLPELRIACDVDNPLLGPNGAAAVYGPQKGLRASEVAPLDAEARRMVELLRARLGIAAGLEDTAGAGAAGGIAFGLMAALGARLVPGFALVADWLELDRRIERATCIITGEGRFDASSLAGKGPGAIAARAHRAGRRCAIFAGAVGGAQSAPAQACEVVAISPSELPLERALAESEQHLSRAIEHWLRTLP